MKLKTLKRRGSSLANAAMQIAILEDEKSVQPKFRNKLKTNGFFL